MSLSKAIRVAGPLGLYQAARFLTARTPRILMYHRFTLEPREGYVSQARFREQVEYIKRYYYPMTLEELTDCLFSDRSVPRNAIVITVDDGYRDFFDVAWPVLNELQVPATLFATTGFIDGKLWLWPDQVTWLFDQVSEVRQKSPAVETDGFIIAEDEATKFRDRTWQRVIDYLLSVPDGKKHQFITQLAAIWNLNLPEKAPDEYAACSWTQLNQMQQNGIEIGGHTVTHPTLGQVSLEQAFSEISGCKRSLDDKLSKPARSFCYPNGMPNDFSTELMEIVEQAGFASAVAAFADKAAMTHRYALRRHSGSEGWFQFYKAVSGVEYLGQLFRGILAEHR